jgi:hypothetical protein
MNAVRRGGAGFGPSGDAGGDAYEDCCGMAGAVGAACAGRAVPPVDVCVT